MGLFVFSRGVISSFFRGDSSSFHVALFHLFVISSFHMALFRLFAWRLFVFSRGVISERKDEKAHTSHHTIHLTTLITAPTFCYNYKNSHDIFSKARTIYLTGFSIKVVKLNHCVFAQKVYREHYKFVKCGFFFFTSNIAELDCFNNEIATVLQQKVFK